MPSPSLFIRVIRVLTSLFRRVTLAGPRVTDEQSAPYRGLNETNTTVTWSNRRETLAKLCDLARENPLAHRLVQLTTDFVVGGGATLEGPPWAHTFWEHPLNDMDARVYRWCDTLSTQGELFIVLSRNPIDGMSYVRELPAINIDAIDTDPNDIEHELRVHQLTDQPEGKWWPVAHELDDADEQVVLHYAINRPPGDVRGYSDLWHTADYLAKYDMWLQDRVRINRYKGAYLWHCRIEGASPPILDAKRAQYSKPPASGTILVTDANEKWEVMQPTIAADDVESDGRAIRLMIAAGSGIPLHFLSEGESATRATAREMGTPTYRHFAHRQYVFEHLIKDVLAHAARRAGQGKIETDIAFDMVLNLGDGNENTPPQPPNPDGDPSSSSGKRRGGSTSAQPNDTGKTTGLGTGVSHTPLGLPELKLYKRIWSFGVNTCFDCRNNVAMGWIPIEQPYPSTVSHPEWRTEPPFHKNCDCFETRILTDNPPEGPWG